VVSLMQIKPGMKVADIGAGTGYFLSYLSRAVGPGGKVLGLDIEPDMVRYMKERATREGMANVEARKVATDDPGLAPGSVDRVLIVNTWHHIPERRAYAGKLAAALARGGIVYIVDFHMDSAHGPPRRHRLKAEAVMRELQSAGLQAEILAEELSEQYVVAARVP
jgi:ubiquinone/menaquinone biosynthesis C-methylase UbiE